MQLKVLFQFLERQLYRPAVFINQSHLFGRYFPIVGDKLVLSAFFVFVVNQAKT